MNTFQKTAENNQYFFYQRGQVKTNNIWNRPSYNVLKEFLIEIKNTTNILEDYDLYLMGGVLYDFNKTWDVDFCITGPLKDQDILESYMNTMYDLSLNKYQFLIDIQWLEQPLPQVSYQEITSSDFKHYQLKYVKTSYIVKQIGEEKTIYDLRNNEGVTKLTEFLVEGIHEKYPSKEKIINRILNNPDKVLKSVFEVKTFLNTDEEYFLNNTNRF